MTGSRMIRPEIEKAIATPVGPNGSPAMKETIEEIERIEVVIIMLLPRAWVVRSQYAPITRGRMSATIVKHAKMSAVLSHLRPNRTSVSGWARAKIMLVQKKVT